MEKGAASYNRSRKGDAQVIAAYTEDEKFKILFAVNSRPSGMTIEQRCDELGVSLSAVNRWRSEEAVSPVRKQAPFTKPKGVKKQAVHRPEFAPLPTKYSGW